jgi:16S rRNA (guanine966-N2)-methyltransferase
MAKKRTPARPRPVNAPRAEKSRMRIVSGKLRGRKIVYYGDRATRPMKDRTRESVFNILGQITSGTVVVDLFAGTGALGIEAISRGAARAEFFETSSDALKTLGENAEQLGIADRVTIRNADAFRRAKRTGDPAERPWLWFCCPPYALVELRRADFIEMIEDFAARAPAGSRFVFEVEENEDLFWLPFEGKWDWRRYSPAWVGILDVDRLDERPVSSPPENSSDGDE